MGFPQLWYNNFLLSFNFQCRRNRKHYAVTGNRKSGHGQTWSRGFRTEKSAWQRWIWKSVPGKIHIYGKFRTTFINYNILKKFPH